MKYEPFCVYAAAFFSSRHLKSRCDHADACMAKAAKMFSYFICGHDCSRMHIVSHSVWWAHGKPVCCASCCCTSKNGKCKFCISILYEYHSLIFLSPLLSVVGHLSQSLELDGRVVPIDLCKFTVWLSFFFFFFCHVGSLWLLCALRQSRHRQHVNMAMWEWCDRMLFMSISRMCVVYLYLARRHDRWQSKSSIHLNRNQLLTSVCYLYDRTFVCFLIWITIVRLMLMARWRQKEHVNLLPTSVERFGSVRMNHCQESIMFGHIGSAFEELG